MPFWPSWASWGLLTPFQTFFVIVGIFSKLGVKTKLAHQDDDDSEFYSISYICVCIYWWKIMNFYFFNFFSSILQEYPWWWWQQWLWGIQIDQLCPNQVGQSPSEGKAMVAGPDWDEDGLRSMMTIIHQGDFDDFSDWRWFLIAD